MKRETISKALNDVDSRYVEEAARPMAARRRVPMKRIAALAAALLLMLSCSVSALAAADVEPAYELLYAVSPALAQTLKPVRMATEDNGIRMEVVSARVEGDTALVYLSLRDLTGDRIDATTDLFDSLLIRRTFDSSNTIRLDHYDEESGTACYLYQMTQLNGRDIRGKKVTVSLSRFLSRKQSYHGELPGIDLMTASADAKTRTVTELRGRSSGDTAAEEVLLPCLNVSPASGASVTAIGFVEGQLHVQLYYEDIARTDNHGWIWLQDEASRIIQCEGSVSFWDEAQRGSYEEYIFPVSSVEELTGYALWGELTLCDMLCEGDWQVTFPLEG